MIKVKGDKIIASKDFYIKWNTHLKISKEAARITRYSQTDMNKRGLPPEEVFPTVQEWLDDADYIVGHNLLGFDIYLIKDYYAYMGQDYKHLVNKIVDTYAIAKGVKIDNRFSPEDKFIEYQYRVLDIRKKGVKTSLVALGKEFEISHNYSKLHDALVDLELNVKVWNKLKWHVEI